MGKLIIYFVYRNIDENLAMVRWARENGIPALYSYLDDLKGPNRYRGSRYMTTKYEARRNFNGDPGFAGGVLTIRERDIDLWKLRWGDLETRPASMTSAIS